MLKKNKKVFLLLVSVLFIFSCKNASKNAEQSYGKDIDELTNAINENPKNAELYYKRAQLLFEKQKSMPAIDDLNKAISIAPDSVKYYLFISDIYFSTVQTRKAKEALEKSLSIDKNNIDANLKLSELYLYVQDHKKSISYADNVFKLNVHQPKAYFLKGMNFKELGDTNKAVSNFQTVVEQDPDYYNAYMQLGILFGLKKNPLAEQYLNTALKLNPQSTEALYARGMFYQDQNQFEKAIADYDEIIKIDPNYAFAHYNKGYIDLVFRKDFNGGIENFTLAIKAKPDYTEAYYMRGKCYEGKGEAKLAKEDFSKALSIDPDFELAKVALR